MTPPENVPDIRNSRTPDIVRELAEYGVRCTVYDPLAGNEEAEREYGLALSPEEELCGADAVIVAVAHSVFREKGLEWVGSLLRQPGRGVVVDVRAMFDERDSPGARYWRL